MNTPTDSSLSPPFSAARFIKEIGRGKNGARSLSRDDARLLYAAMLARQISDLELGAVLLAMRIKGETVDEIAGFLDAAHASFDLLDVPPLGLPDEHSGTPMPIVIPSYNGARKIPNLTPLLAMLLARENIPVLVHGVLHDAGRVTTAEIFTALGWPLATSIGDAEKTLATGQPAFMPIAILAPQIAALLALRQVLGVRSSTHTLVKILQPFRRPALLLSSYTHPEYLLMLSDYFTKATPAERGDALLMRGTEGETVANTKRAQQIDWFHEGIRRTLEEKQGAFDLLPDLPPELPPDRDALTTARWIMQVLDGSLPVPQAIATQVTRCAAIAKGQTIDFS
ncbi:MAG: DNA-binding protein YbiB [Pseudomonadota bacterium]